MYGLSYWTDADGERLSAHLKEIFENAPGGKERYWDEVALGYYIDEYKIWARPCTFDDIIEIDTFNELKKIDKNYAV
jgi:CTP:phosphocholine cytidylyltransferase-like protein